jgi:xanthine dehydrogenase accessory factor
MMAPFDPVVALKGAGEMVSAVAWRLHVSHVRRIFMLELPQPLAVRRQVSFSEAVYQGIQRVEGVTAVRAYNTADFEPLWKAGLVPVLVDETWTSVRRRRPDVIVDGILAKRNLGTHIDDAPLVIGLGPGFTAGVDAHAVVSTGRGHNLGRVITYGCDEPNTGVPDLIGGYGIERVLRAPCDGVIRPACRIGDRVAAGDLVATVADIPVRTLIAGVVRGLLRSGVRVTCRTKIGDVDPRSDAVYCSAISDKARAIAGGVLEALLRAPHSTHAA